MAKQLKTFTISGEGDDYVLRIESEDGDTLELAASYDQLDLIAEAVEERLNSDEESALAVQDGD